MQWFFCIGSLVFCLIRDITVTRQIVSWISWLREPTGVLKVILRRLSAYRSGSQICGKHAPCITEIQRGIAFFNQFNRKAKNDNLLLLLDFVTVHDYLFQLRLLAHCLQPLGASALYYLAAAVSDFHIPPSRMSEHKIQSEGGGSTFTIVMDPVPKFLHHLVQKWAPTATIISFKVCSAVNCAHGISWRLIRIYSFRKLGIR